MPRQSLPYHFSQLTSTVRRAEDSLTCDVFDIFSNCSFSPRTLASKCLFICKKIFFSDSLLELSSHVIDFALNWNKYMWSFKLQEVNRLENCRFVFQSLNLSWLYVFLSGDSENILFFCHYFIFWPSPSPYPIDIRCNWNKRNKSLKPDLFSKLGGYSHSYKSKLVKDSNYKFS